MKALVYTHRFQKLAQKLPPPIKAKLKRQLLLLAADPTHPSLGVKKMVGKVEVWEARVDVHYRLTFHRDNDQLILKAVGTHAIYR